MKNIKRFDYNNLSLVILIDEVNQCRLVYAGISEDCPNKFYTDDLYKWHRLCEIQISGGNQNDHHFAKLTGSSEAFALNFVSAVEFDDAKGKLVVVTQRSDTIEAKSFYLLNSCSISIRAHTEVRNISEQSIRLECVSSFAEVDLLASRKTNWDNNYEIYMPHNSWYGECMWKKYKPSELGMYNVQSFSSKRVSASNTGGWSCMEYLPMGMLARKSDNMMMAWQIEHNGSWHWEISTMSDSLYLIAGGPTHSENGWSKELKPGESFVSVACAVTYGIGIDCVIGEMTKYRRQIMRPCEDNTNLPVIFNDYMNCLGGNPTTEKELPMIDVAAQLGCEYYCIDAGWYDDGDWWDTVGEWQPAKNRFKDGLQFVTDYIVSKGMKPGLWLEIEVMGINSPLAKSLDDSWFFMRYGKRVIDHGRYQLDFSNPKVRAFADSVVDRLIRDYKLGYLKLDYNINCGVGTEFKSDSFGDGLFKHNRAFLMWLDSVFIRYPSLVIESCASGGMRMDYAMLSRLSIQSVTDQTDYKKMAAISANCVTAVTPEQAAIWSYPFGGADDEQVVFNMVNAMLMRVHQSGQVLELSQSGRKLVKEGIDVYKKNRQFIKDALPLFLSNLEYFDAKWLAFGLKKEKRILVCVWSMNNTDDIDIVLNQEIKSANIIYPIVSVDSISIYGNTFKFSSPNSYTARLIEIILL